MSNFIKIICLVSVSILILSSCSKQEKQASVITVQSYLGDVKIEGAKGAKTPAQGLVLEKIDKITTAGSSYIDLLYMDRGIIHVSENSTLQIADLTVSANASNSEINLDKGKTVITMGKLMKGTTFSVTTSTTVAAIRGTTFRVQADKAKSKIDVLSGAVKVTPVAEGKPVEEASTVLKTNTAVEVTEEAAKDIEKKGESLQPRELSSEELEQAGKEIEEISERTETAPEVKKEINDEVKEIKKTIEVKKEAEKELKKIEKAPVKAKVSTASAEKKISSAEEAAKKRIEQEKIEKKKEREKVERRVKNIPNL